jgi:hypothetical protein
MSPTAAAKSLLSGALCLHPFYVARPGVWSPQLWEIDARIAISLERKYCYVRVPKSANTAVISTLFHHETGRRLGGRHIKRAFKRPSALLRPDLRGFYCFSFVRNPYDRVLSAYLSKLAASEHKSPYRAIGSRVRRRYGGGALTFPAFCAYLDAEGPYGNPHWYPQHRYIDAFGAERLDFIGRVERLDEDLARVVERIYGRADGSTYRTGTKSGASGKLAQHYDEASRQIVRRLYREDFERFGYDPASSPA